MYTYAGGSRPKHFRRHVDAALFAPDGIAAEFILLSAKAFLLTHCVLSMDGGVLKLFKAHRYFDLLSRPLMLGAFGQPWFTAIVICLPA